MMKQRHLLRLRQHLAAARAILAEPDSAAEEAAPHVLAAWQSLADVFDLPLKDRDDMEALCKVAQAERVFLMENPAATYDVLRRAIASGEAPGRWRGALRRHTDRLHGLGDRVARSQGLEPLDKTAWRWFVRALVLVALASAIYLAIERPWLNWNHGPWRAAYYPTKNFNGDPVMRRERYLNHNWGKGPAVDSIPADRFSARWDSCLVIEQPIRVPMQLVVNDHARLYIGGKEVLSKWHRKRRLDKPVGAVVEFEPGVHHLRVDFEEEKVLASIDLLASFDGRRPDRIPQRMLKFPGLEPPKDDENPCGSTAPDVRVVDRGLPLDAHDERKKKARAKRKKKKRSPGEHPPPPEGTPTVGGDEESNGTDDTESGMVP